MSILAWLCIRDPAISFLPRDRRAEWIVFPTAVDATLHRFVSLDTVFRREFLLDRPPRTARLSLRADRRAEVRINGEKIEIGLSRNWKDVLSTDVRARLQTGSNSIDVRVFNHSGPQALWLLLIADQFTLPSDQIWQASLAGSAPRQAALARGPKIPGPGNPIGGGEQTFSALLKVWPIWLAFAMAATVICAVATGLWPVRRRKTKLMEERPTGPWLQKITLPAIVTLLWLMLFWNNAALLPYHTGFDSRSHLAYIKYVQEHRTLPLPTEGWEMYQPPLYYIASASALSMFGLSIDDSSSVFVLRLLNTLFGIAQFLLVFLSLRLLFPTRIGVQSIGLLLAGFLSMHLYLAHYVTNEMLAATLTTAAIYLALRLLGSETPSIPQHVWLGLSVGAAMLTKATGVLLLPVLVAAIAGRLAVQRAPIAIWVTNLAAMLAACFAVCGWYYARIWLRFGTPLLGNWDVTSGFAWWQEPGYHTTADYFRFGRSLVSPLFSGFNGVLDGIYSTLWGDGLCGGMARLVSPWNNELLVAGYLLALIPTALILFGVGVALTRLLRKPSAELFLLLGLAAAIALGLIFMTLRVASYAQAKAFYGLSILTPLCFLGALGWDAVTRGRRFLTVPLGMILVVWAMNSFASVWIIDSVSRHVFALQKLVPQGKMEVAEWEAAKAVRSNPSDPTSRRFHALTLKELGRSEEALKEAERAVELDPLDSSARLWIAISSKHTQPERALAEARRAIELGRENSDAYAFLVSCLLEMHRNDEVIKIAHDGLAVSPFGADIHYALALASAEEGDLETAANQFGYVMMLRPDLEQAHAQLRRILLSLAKSNNGASRLHAIGDQAPDSPRMLDELAWLFATHPDPRMRDGREAVRLAERACILTDRRLPALLDTLAAAHAEAGNFSRAVSTAEEALALARSAGDTDGVTLSEKILATIRENLPYREEPIRE